MPLGQKSWPTKQLRMSKLNGYKNHNIYVNNDLKNQNFFQVQQINGQIMSVFYITR